MLRLRFLFNDIVMYDDTSHLLKMSVTVPPQTRIFSQTIVVKYLRNTRPLFVTVNRVQRSTLILGLMDFHTLVPNK